MNRLALSKHARLMKLLLETSVQVNRKVQLPVILDVDGFRFGPGGPGKSSGDDQCKLEHTNSALSVMISSNTEHLSLSRMQHSLCHEFQE
jgi:hypothetical protein